ncbi:MAG: hypothetical protein VXB01_08950, partial [Opitutae bacterium]
FAKSVNGMLASLDKTVSFQRLTKNRSLHKFPLAPLTLQGEWKWRVSENVNTRTALGGRLVFADPQTQPYLKPSH